MSHRNKRGVAGTVSSHTGAHMVHRKITYDGFYEEWTCDLGGPGDPKVVCDSKDKLERFLDYLDNRNRKRTEVAHGGRGD